MTEVLYPMTRLAPDEEAVNFVQGTRRLRPSGPGPTLGTV